MKGIKTIGIKDAFKETVQISVVNKEEKVIGLAPIYSNKKFAKKASEKGKYNVVEVVVGDFE
ncbi:MAG: hypothetical protein ACTSO3_00985 [Candidatus Heimdallarchaeaceae archaeon]